MLRFPNVHLLPTLKYSLNRNVFYLTRDYTAGLLTSGENLLRLKDGEFTRNLPHFAGHYFINFHLNQPTGENYRRVYLRPGKMRFGKNMAKLSRIRHLIPVRIIPSKVVKIRATKHENLHTKLGILKSKNQLFENHKLPADRNKKIRYTL